MTLMQFKGVIEKRFFCNIPDEMFFLPSVSLLEIAKAVKVGTVTSVQRQSLDQGGLDDAQVKGPNSSPTVMVHQRQPLCPWFTCCY